ncbi:MAG: divalent metal cation transporter, partial [Clostridia bacterium]|nr:divalent metal cation transporter [Clostridia bacterium]
DNKYREAPAFFGIYSFIIAVGSLLILIPGLQLMKLIIITQQIAGILSPIILIFMSILVNDKRIMGKYTNTKVQNAVSFATVAFIVALSLVLLVSPVLS